jgi:nitrogen fixation NifU-like protein
MTTLYQEEILEHYRHPQHHGRLEHPTITRMERNSSCGDELVFDLKIENGMVSEVAFEGEGCAISQATASMLTEELLNQPLDTIMQLSTEDIVELVHIPLGPTRLKCALLSLQAVTAAIAEYKKESA